VPKHVDFLVEALEEAEAAVDWYAERAPDVATAFAAELAHGVEVVARTPGTWPQHIRGTQRYRLRGFPFALVYLNRPDTVIIVAVAHERRRPGYWRFRRSG
jgi:toxin ParE1/3/4